ncbi:hypothetical protein P376_4226 [Streptomyces sp. HCCB10043]|nr:hypothetical protein P376_4226 [Streptomyces sp. HCCB10043]
MARHPQRREPVHPVHPGRLESGRSTRGTVRARGLHRHVRDPRRHLRLRRPALRDDRPRGPPHRPPAAALPGMRAARAGERRLSRRAGRQEDRGLRQRGLPPLQHAVLPDEQRAAERGHRRLAGRDAGAGRQLHRLQRHPGRLPPRPHRPRDQRADRLLQLTGRRPTGGQLAAAGRMRHRAGGLRIHPRPAGPRLPLRQGVDPLQDRPSAGVRRLGRRHGGGYRHPRRRPQAAGPRPRRRRHRARRDPRLGRLQRRLRQEDVRGSQPERPAEGGTPRPGPRGRRRGHHRLPGDPRYGDAEGRSDRARRSERGLPSGHRPHRILRARRDQGQHRAPGRRRRTGRTRQDPAGTQTRSDPADRGVQHPQPAAGTGVQPVLRARRPAALAGDRHPSPRRRHLARRRRHQCPPRPGRGARARAAHPSGRPAAGRAPGLRDEPGGSRRQRALAARPPPPTHRPAGGRPGHHRRPRPHPRPAPDRGPGRHPRPSGRSPGRLAGPRREVTRARA